MNYDILIVEDSKLISNNLKKCLEEDGHNVEQAFDFFTAVEQIQSHRFDYILLDLILPDGEGEMLMPYAKHADARVIVMTTDRDSFRRDRMFGFGIVDYIIKDRYFDDIIESIRRMIRQVDSNSRQTLLVVDDSHFIRNHLELLLSSRGFLVLSAADGKEAYELMKKYPIDALIADLEMPVMDGFGLIAKVRRNEAFKNIPVMILTGSNDSNKIAKVIKHGVKDLIRKPYIVEEVLLKIDNMMNAVSQRHLLEREQCKFDLYHDAIVNSTLYMKFSPDLHAVYVNARFSELVFGLKAEKFKPILLRDLIKNPTMELFRSLQRLSPKSPPVNYIYTFERYDASTCYISAAVSGIFDAEGALVEMIFIGHDVTQLQENEQSLSLKVEEQVQLNLEQQQLMFNQAKMAAMGEMIGNIAHQWRQPLNTLALMIQNFEDAHAYGEMTESYVEETAQKAMHQIEFMSKTIDDFRNFFEPNKQKERFDVAEAIANTMDIMEKTLHSHAITIRYEGVQKHKYLAMGYRNELQQVILNLLSNANDILCDKEGERWIMISLSQDEKMLCLSIEDNGGGVSETVIERIFEPYFTTKAEGKGTGVGLYMSKMIMEKNMQGSLSVRNTAFGACFSACLPLEQNLESEPE
ncbi:MAG: response regulator [Campylobacterales bacterium]|nr:response regulator [Campylobacterales bacterium]